MKRFLVVGVLLALLAAGLVFAFLELQEERHREAEAEAPVVAPSRVTPAAAPGADSILKLDAATQERLGLKTARPIAGSVTPEMVAPVTVLDPGPVVAAARELAAAEIDLETARRDFERKRALHENGRNAPASAVEQASAQLDHARIAVTTARDHLAAAAGPRLAQHPELSKLLSRLADRSAALVRVDLPAAATALSPPASSALFRPSGSAAGTAEWLGPAPATESGLSGGSHLGLVQTNAAGLAPGAMLETRLTSGPPRPGTVLPGSAVLRHAGLGWVYVQTAPDTFARRPAPLDTPHSDGWLAPGAWTEPVVIQGAQTLLSEELKHSIQMVD